MVERRGWCKAKVLGSWIFVNGRGRWAWSLGGASLNSTDPWKLEPVLWGKEKSKDPNYKKPLSGRSRQTDRNSLSGSALASVTYQSRLSGGPCL